MTVLKMVGQSYRKTSGSSEDYAMADGYNRIEDRGSDSTVDYLGSNFDTVADSCIEAGSWNGAWLVAGSFGYNYVAAVGDIGIDNFGAQPALDSWKLAGLGGSASTEQVAVVDFLKVKVSGVAVAEFVRG